MDHMGTKTIETSRLILRQFREDDANAMFDNWANDDEVTRYLMWPTHKSVEVSRSYIDILVQGYGKLNNYNWGIELKETGQVIGSIGAAKIDENVESVHIGYCLGRQWWNRGITSEAFHEVIRFFMDEVKVNRIDSRHDPKNMYSGRVMQKCGLLYEGTLHQSDYNNQGICDASWYGLLRSDYYLHIGMEE